MFPCGSSSILRSHMGFDVKNERTVSEVPVLAGYRQCEMGMYVLVAPVRRILAHSGVNSPARCALATHHHPQLIT